VQHHEDSIARYVRRIREVDGVRGVIVHGSVTNRNERPDSDVDLFLLLTDEAFDDHVRQGRLSYVDREGISYEGGYYDIKVINREYLRAAADHGDEPTRASFLNARVAWSRADDLEELVAAIPKLSPAEWDRRMASFIAQVRLQGGYFLKQADQLDNTFLLHHAAVHLVGAGGRALLALNQTLYQGQKYLEQTLVSLPRIPDGYQDHAAAVLDHPSAAAGAAYCELLEAYHPWPLEQERTLSTFVEENELGWLTGVIPPEYC